MSKDVGEDTSIYGQVVAPLRNSSHYLLSIFLQSTFLSSNVFEESKIQDYKIKYRS